MKKRIAWLFICTFCLCVFVACNPTKKTNSLKIGYIHEPPYSYVSAEGEAKGVFPDAARKIAKDLNYFDIKWVLMSFDNLLPALKDERIDIIAAGMTGDAVRKKLVCFSVPLVTSKSAALWPKNLESFDPRKPLVDQNVTYAVVNGSIEAHYLKPKLPEHRVIEIEDAYVGLYSMQQNKADVLLLTEPSLRYLAQTNQDQYHVDNTRVFLDDTHQVSFVFKKDDEALVKRWNQAQIALMQTPSFKDTVKPLAFSIPFPDNRKESTCDNM